MSPVYGIRKPSSFGPIVSSFTGSNGCRMQPGKRISTNPAARYFSTSATWSALRNSRCTPRAHTNPTNAQAAYAAASFDCVPVGLADPTRHAVIVLELPQVEVPLLLDFGRPLLGTGEVGVDGETGDQPQHNAPRYRVFTETSQLSSDSRLAPLASSSRAATLGSIRAHSRVLHRNRRRDPSVLRRIRHNYLDYNDFSAESSPA